MSNVETNVNLTDLEYLIDLSNYLEYEPEKFNLDSENSGYVNVSLSDLTDSKDIAKVKPLYDVLKLDHERSFMSCKIDKGMIQYKYAPVMRTVDMQPSLTIGGYNYRVSIERPVDESGKIIKDADLKIFLCVFTRSKEDSKVEVESKLPLYYVKGSQKGLDGVEKKTLDFTLDIPQDDDTISYTFRCLLNEEITNVDVVIDSFIKAVRNKKVLDAEQILISLLKLSSTSKKVNIDKAFTKMFTDGHFEKICAMYPKNLLGIIAKSARYGNDNYGAFIELEVDFAFYCKVWGVDYIVNAQGKEVLLSECNYLVFKSNHINSSKELMTAYAQSLQTQIRINISGQNPSNVKFYPKFSANLACKTPPEHYQAFLAFGLNPPLDTKQSQKTLTTSKQNGEQKAVANATSFSAKANDFNFG